VLLFLTNVTGFRHATGKRRLDRFMKLEMGSSNILYRNARESDILGIARLCSASFDNEFSAEALSSQLNSVENFEQQFSDRYFNYIKSGKKTHGMVVAAEVAASEETSPVIVGFAEIGLLPPPLSSLRLMRGDVPYLGNIAVASEFRRSGVGSRLVRIGIKMAEKWGSDCIYVAVKVANSAAINMYSKIGFTVVFDESKGPFPRPSDVARIFMTRDITSTALGAPTAS